MSDLIERQAALDAINSVFPLKNFSNLDIIGMTRTAQIWECAEAIEKLPTIEAEPVRKGEWIITSEFEDCYYAKCNQCNITQVFYFNKPTTNYCPNCGARMQEGEE